MHQANKYMRVQDQNGQIAVIVPETDFILHARQMRDLTNKVEQMNGDLKLLNGKHHEYINYQKRTEEKIATEVQKARTKQRQEDAKVYAHWRDKCKSFEKSTMLSGSKGNILVNLYLHIMWSNASMWAGSIISPAKPDKDLTEHSFKLR